MVAIVDVVALDSSVNAFEERGAALSSAQCGRRGAEVTEKESQRNAFNKAFLCVFLRDLCASAAILVTNGEQARRLHNYSMCAVARAGVWRESVPTRNS